MAQLRAMYQQRLQRRQRMTIESIPSAHSTTAAALVLKSLSASTDGAERLSCFASPSLRVRSNSGNNSDKELERKHSSARASNDHVPRVKSGVAASMTRVTPEMISKQIGNTLYDPPACVISAAAAAAAAGIADGGDMTDHSTALSSAFNSKALLSPTSPSSAAHFAALSEQNASVLPKFHASGAQFKRSKGAHCVSGNASAANGGAAAALPLKKRRKLDSGRVEASRQGTVADAAAYGGNDTERESPCSSLEEPAHNLALEDEDAGMARKTAAVPGAEDGETSEETSEECAQERERLDRQSFQSMDAAVGVVETHYSTAAAALRV